jgi:hypothetical protein
MFNIALLWRLIRPSRNPAGWLVLFIIAHAACGPLVSTVRLGQVNILLGTLVFGALLFERDDEPVLAGFLLSLAILIKLTPLVFLVDFIVRGRWRTLLATLFFGTGLTMGSVLWIGIDPWLAFLGKATQPIPFNPLMSLNGLVGAVGTQLGFPPLLTIAVFLVVLSIVLLRLVWRLPQLTGRRPGTEDGPASVPPAARRASPREAPVASWGLLTLFSLLAFPLTWHHHYYLALLPFAFFTMRSFDRGWTSRGWVWLLLGVVVLLRYPGILHPIKPVASLLAIFLI